MARNTTKSDYGIRQTLKEETERIRALIREKLRDNP